MDVRYRFPLLRPVLVEDAWPIETQKAVVELERKGLEVTAVVVSFRHQSVEMAPTVSHKPGEAVAHIVTRDALEADALRIIKRFHSFINTAVPLHMDFEEREVEYIPADDEERSKLGILSIKSSYERRSPISVFSTFAQALYAVESEDDPSFASTLAQMSRDAFDQKLYIDAFRYSFLLFEGLYGNGQFKKEALALAMHSHADFVKVLQANIKEFQDDPLHASSKGRALATTYATASEMIAHLYERRGVYFHGNLRRRDMWRPDQQEEAEGLADFCVFLSLAVAHLFADAMYTPEVAQRYFENAKKQGAIMTIVVKFKARDDQGRVKQSKMTVNVPGTVATNGMAIYVQRKFLEWAETELHRRQLIAAVARVEATGAELFRAQYLVSDLARTPDEAPDGER